MVQGGDYENFDGTNGKSFMGGTFPDESFVIKHDREGVVRMANKGKDTNSLHFFIATGKNGAPHLDGKHVAFGQLISGMEVIKCMEHVELDGERPVPMQWIVIVDCGILEHISSSGNDSDSSASSSEGFRKHKKARHKHKEQDKHSKPHRSRSRDQGRRHGLSDLREQRRKRHSSSKKSKRDHQKHCNREEGHKS